MAVKELNGVKILSDRTTMVDVDQLRPFEGNPRRGDVEAIAANIRSVGWWGSIVARRSTREVLVGNHRVLAARMVQLPKVPTHWVECDDKTAAKMVAADNRASDRGDYDLGELTALLQSLDGDLEGSGYDTSDLEAMAAGLTEDILPTPAPATGPVMVLPGQKASAGTQGREVRVVEPPPVVNEPPPVKIRDPLTGETLTREEARDRLEALYGGAQGAVPETIDDSVPDVVWPSDHMDVPWLLLDPDLIPDAVHAPAITFGAMHKPTSCGTLLFYVHDTRMDVIYRSPQKAFRFDPVAIVEPNFSATEQSPLPVVLYNIWRKRWLARYWQSRGLKVFVDINVHPAWEDYILLGVPEGWTAYATRGSSKTEEELMWEWNLAVERADGATPLLLVYGGSKDIKSFCASQHTWTYVPEAMRVVRGQELAFGHDYSWIRPGQELDLEKNGVIVDPKTGKLLSYKGKPPEE